MTDLSEEGRRGIYRPDNLGVRVKWCGYSIKELTRGKDSLVHLFFAQFDSLMVRAHQFGSDVEAWQTPT